jgi:hypothetical protein
MSPIMQHQCSAFSPLYPLRCSTIAVALLVFVACLPACDQYHVIVYNLVSPLPGVLKQISQMYDSNSNILPRSWTEKCSSFSNTKLQFYLLLCVDAQLWPLWAPMLQITNSCLCSKGVIEKKNRIARRAVLRSSKVAEASFQRRGWENNRDLLRYSFEPKTIYGHSRKFWTRVEVMK